MMMFKKIFVDQAVSHLPEVSRMKQQLNVPFENVSDITAIFKKISQAPDPVDEGKKYLLLTQNKGAFVKKCPGTSNYTCCDYQILHIGTFCVMDCSYCILQAYFHPPLLQYFVNHDDLYRELDSIFSGMEVVRIGTGEFTDSLIWEPWTCLNHQLIDRFSGQQQAILELKTKTVHIDNLLDLPHNRKTILSWSLNTPRIIKSEERRTSSLVSRLKAAQKCEEKGYALAFHFDPMVVYEGCTDEYKQVVDLIFDHVSPENITYISIGTFRYIPDIYNIIQNRFPHSKLPYGEFVQGLDGKMRYFKPIRIELYRQFIDHIRKKAPDVFLYFCMEDEEVWQKCMGFHPDLYGGLGKMLDNRVTDICRLHPRGSI